MLSPLSFILLSAFILHPSPFILHPSSFILYPLSLILFFPSHPVFDVVIDDEVLFLVSETIMMRYIWINWKIAKKITDNSN